MGQALIILSFYILPWLIVFRLIYLYLFTPLVDFTRNRVGR